MRTIRRAGSIVMLSGVIVLIGAATPESHVRAATISEPITTSIADDCALKCWQAGCDSGWHLAIVTTQSHLNSQWGSGPHYDFNCYEGTCDDEHEECTPEAEGLEQLRAALAAADVVAVAAAIAERQDFVAVNTARSAVQVSNCRGEVLAHLPVSKAFASRVQTVLKASNSLQ